MASSFGNTIKYSVFGQSHGPAIGVVIDGLPAGEAIDLSRLAQFMDRRVPGKAAYATARKEADLPEVLSGLVDGYTCGAPLAMLIRNTDTRSKDYSSLKDQPRPSHADYPAHIRYSGFNDVRGGGHFSGRLTAPICAAGGVALQILARRGIYIGAHIASVEGICDAEFDPVSLSKEDLQAPGRKPFSVIDDEAGQKMQQAISEAAREGDSVGGVVECGVIGMPVGIGDPMFDGVENRLAAALFGIPAVRGLEFGAGFAAAAMRGSQHNDAYTLREGKVCTVTNRHGGVIGGITTGMPILFRLAFKPTPSIHKAQQTVSLSRMEETPLVIEGRHDPCIVPRAVPCVEAVTALVLLDLLFGSSR